jgi:hypothetical protein
MRVTAIILGTLLMVGFLACGPPDWSLDPSGKLSVPCTHQPSSDELIVLRLRVAPLPEGSGIEVFTLDNTHVGGVAPFGVRPGSKARYYSIPVPTKAVVGKEVIVRLEVVDRSGKKKRPPTGTEIEGATLVFTPIARHPGDRKP